jgi:hypothetical protein
MNNHNGNQPGRKPNYIAYNVNYAQNGQSYSNRVGAAWNHKDGQGLDIQLESIPVDGRVTLRERRDEQMQAYDNQRQQQGQQQNQDQFQQQQGYEQNMINAHERSR